MLIFKMLFHKHYALAEILSYSLHPCKAGDITIRNDFSESKYFLLLSWGPHGSCITSFIVEKQWELWDERRKCIIYVSVNYGTGFQPLCHNPQVLIQCFIEGQTVRGEFVVLEELDRLKAEWSRRLSCVQKLPYNIQLNRWSIVIVKHCFLLLESNF